MRDCLVCGYRFQLRLHQQRKVYCSKPCKQFARNARLHERAMARDVTRRLARPRCVMCSTPLTPMEFRRGITCGPKCSRLRWKWFGRGRVR